jgi:hypothetical protein
LHLARYNGNFDRVRYSETGDAKVHSLPQLNSTRGRPEYRAHINFPHSWKGGWWILRDIVEQQKISALAALELAANYRELILRNLRLKAMRAHVEKKPYALIFHPEQHDPLTAYKLLEALNSTGVKTLRADEDFRAEGIRYNKGTFLVAFNQISRAYLMSTMRRRLYHDNPWARSPEGMPIDLQDIAGYNPTEQYRPEDFDSKLGTPMSLRGENWDNINYLQKSPSKNFIDNRNKPSTLEFQRLDTHYRI